MTTPAFNHLVGMTDLDVQQHLMRQLEDRGYRCLETGDDFKVFATSEGAETAIRISHTSGDDVWPKYARWAQTCGSISVPKIFGVHTYETDDADHYFAEMENPKRLLPIISPEVVWGEANLNDLCFLWGWGREYNFDEVFPDQLRNLVFDRHAELLNIDRFAKNNDGESTNWDKIDESTRTAAEALTSDFSQVMRTILEWEFACNDFTFDKVRIRPDTFELVLLDNT